MGFALLMLSYFSLILLKQGSGEGFERSATALSNTIQLLYYTVFSIWRYNMCDINKNLAKITVSNSVKQSAITLHLFSF